MPKSTTTADASHECACEEPRVAYVYVLGYCDENGPRSYVGWTFEPERRLTQHNSGTRQGARSTRGRQWQLLYIERLTLKQAAMSREYHLKRDRRQRRALLDWAYGTPPSGLSAGSDS